MERNVAQQSQRQQTPKLQTDPPSVRHYTRKKALNTNVRIVLTQNIAHS